MRGKGHGKYVLCVNGKRNGMKDGYGYEIIETFQVPTSDFLAKKLAAARAEGYEQGQTDAFAGKIESMKSVLITETYNVPEVLRTHFRQEGANEERERIAEIVGEKYDRVGEQYSESIKNGEDERANDMALLTAYLNGLIRDAGLPVFEEASTLSNPST